MISLKVVVNEQGAHLLFLKDYTGKGQSVIIFSFCDCLSFDDVQFLEILSTSRILLPQTTLYSIWGQFKGYTTCYIENLGLLHFMSLPTSLVLSNFKLLQTDCSTLGSHHVLVADFMAKDYRICNHSFRDGLYFIDSGRYFRNYQYSVEEIIQKIRMLLIIFCFLGF